MSVLSRASLRYLAHHPSQLALSVLGVALGVAVVVGIELASHSAQRAFELASGELAGAATHVLRGGRSGVPEELYSRLRRDPASLADHRPEVEEVVVVEPVHAATIHRSAPMRYLQNRYWTAWARAP